MSRLLTDEAVRELLAEHASLFESRLIALESRPATASSFDPKLLETLHEQLKTLIESTVTQATETFLDKIDDLQKEIDTLSQADADRKAASHADPDPALEEAKRLQVQSLTQVLIDLGRTAPVETILDCIEESGLDDQTILEILEDDAIPFGTRLRKAVIAGLTQPEVVQKKSFKSIIMAAATGFNRWLNT